MQTITIISHDYPKAPRWINTEAGAWAWVHVSSWRGQAASALGVQERSVLLAEAAQHFAATQTQAAEAEPLAA